MPRSRSVDYPTVQDMIEPLRQELERVSGIVDEGGSNTGGLSDLTPIGPWPVAVRNEHGKAIVRLRCAVPTGTVELKTVIEQYSGSGASVTVERSMNDVTQVKEVLPAGGVFDYDFDVRLRYNKKYGCPRLIAIMDNGSRVRNPTNDPPLEDDRIESDYLITFTLGGPFGNPSDPSQSLIVLNTLDTNTDVYDALTTFRIYAPLNVSAAQTWQAAIGTETNKTLEVLAIIRNLLGKKFTAGGPLSSTELTQVDPGSVPPNRGFVDVTLRKETPGEELVWELNRMWAGDIHSDSTGASVNYFAGARNQTIGNLTGVNLILQAGAPNDAKHQALYLEFTQPAGTAVALKNASIDLKLQTDPDTLFREVVDRRSLKEDALVVPGQAYTFANGLAPLLDQKLKVKPNTNYTLRLRLKAINDVEYKPGGVYPTFNLSTGNNPEVPADTAPPTGLSQPELRFLPGRGLHFGGMTVSSNFNQAVDKQLVVYNGGASFLDLPAFISSNGQTVQFTSEALARLSIGPGVKKHLIEIGLNKLRILFGSVSIFGYFYASNVLGNTRSPDSTALPLTSVSDNTNGQNGSNKADPGLAGQSDNMLQNSDFLGLSAGDLNKWTSWNGSSTPIAPASAINSASANLRLNQTSHSVLFLNTTRILIYNLKKGRILRSGSYSFSVKARANTTLTGVGLLLRVVVYANDNGNNNTNDGSLIIPDIELTPLDTTYREYGTITSILPTARIDDGANPVDQVFAIQLIGVLGGNQVEIDQVKLDRSAAPTLWAPHPNDEGILDYVTSGPLVTTDLVNVTVSTAGSAGRFLIERGAL